MQGLNIQIWNTGMLIIFGITNFKGMFLKIALETAVVAHAYNLTYKKVGVKRTRIHSQSFGNNVNLKSVWST